MESDSARHRVIEIIRAFFKLRICLVKMLKVRGYATSEHEVTFDQYAQQFSHFRDCEENEGLCFFRMETAKHHPDDDKIVCFICAEKKIGVGTAQRIIESLKTSKTLHAILCYKSGVTPKASETLADGKSFGIWVESFSYEEALVDINGNPNYKIETEVITDPEKEQKLISKYGNKDCFPTILKGDPRSKYYGLRLGDIIKVTSPSDTAGVYSVYQVCRTNPNAEDVFTMKNRKK